MQCKDNIIKMNNGGSVEVGEDEPADGCDVGLTNGDVDIGAGNGGTEHHYWVPVEALEVDKVACDGDRLLWPVNVEELDCMRLV